MKRKHWLILGSIIIVGAGVGTYFYIRKKNRKYDTLDPSELEEDFDKSTSVGSEPNLVEQAFGGGLESTPFKNKAEGDAFRKWVNDNYPSYAREIDLDPSGDYNNTFIRKAWKKYGSVYSKASNTKGLENRDLLRCLRQRFADWGIPYKTGVDKNGKSYVKLKIKNPKYPEVYWLTYYGSGNVYVYGVYGSRNQKTMGLVATYDNGTCEGKIGNWLMMKGGKTAYGKSMKNMEFYDVNDKKNNPIRPIRLMLQGWRGNVASWWDGFKAVRP